VYQDVVRHWPARGNQVPDTHLAALLRQRGVGTLYTSDADFRRFDFLRIVNPFA
jgi:predicted nucleic acid-binding protein